MKVLKNGKEKAFYTHCITCGSDLEYTFEDVRRDNGEKFKMQYIICPVCGEKLIANMETKKEAEMWTMRTLRAWNSACNN